MLTVIIFQWAIFVFKLCIYGWYELYYGVFFYNLVYFVWIAAGPIPLRVREAEIPIVSDAECIRKINAVTEKIFILPASSFCAGGEEGNDACQVNYLIEHPLLYIPQNILITNFKQSLMVKKSNSLIMNKEK